MYKKTKFANIYATASSYRARKVVNGKKHSAYFSKLKDARKWLSKFE